MHSDELIAQAGSFHPLDAMSPAALSGLLQRGPFRSSVETGCGGSTIVLSHAAESHLAFALEGPDRTITDLRRQPGLRAERVTFAEGETRDTLPRFPFQGDFDLALLDGPHAYPLPQLEFAYLGPRIGVGGWLVLDDIQIPSVHQLFRFLKEEPAWKLEEIAVRTVFFRRIAAPAHHPDPWPLQGINRHTILRYSWRDRLRRLLGRS
jgi:hypothetical protein